MSLPIAKRCQTILNGIIQNQRIATTYIFYGKPGAFLSTAAHYFAKSLNCLDREASPCGQCRNCKMIQANAFPDIRSTTADTKLSIDTIRQIQNDCKYGPAIGNYFISIIPKADSMTPEAANALLKTLEEPPHNTCFILLTDSPFALLDTIRSRAQLLDFPLPSPQDIQNYVATLPPDKQSQFNTIHLNPTHYFRLETLSDTEPDPLPEFFQFTQQPLIHQLLHCQDLSKDKQRAKDLLISWCQTLTQHSPDSPQLTILTDAYEQLRYNLNLRLHLEATILRLNS